MAGRSSKLPASDGSLVIRLTQLQHIYSVLFLAKLCADLTSLIIKDIASFAEVIEGRIGTVSLPYR
jgi:hypothetical protein